MTTDRDGDGETVEEAGPESTGKADPKSTGTADPGATEGSDEAGAVPGARPDPDGDGDPDGDADGGTGDAAGGDTADAGAAVSEAQAELAAQREFRRRIEERRAQRPGPVTAGGKLSGQAAHLLAAVRAVESGGTPDPAVLRATRPDTAPAGAAATPPPSPTAPSSLSEPGTAASPEALAAVRTVLAEGGAPAALAEPVARVLGEQAGEALRQDPWQLLAVPGVRPEQADGFARALLGAACAPEDERRAVALVAWLLERAALQGHTALEAATVRTELGRLGVPGPEAAVRHAVAQGAVLVFQEREEAAEAAEAAGATDEHGTEAEAGSDAGTDGADEGEPGTSAPVLLGLDRYALAEESLADALAALVKTVRDVPQEPWAEAGRSAPSPSAAELLRAVAAHGLVLHTGGETARAEPVAVAAAGRALGLRTAVAVHSENGRDRLRAAGPVTDVDVDVDVVTVAGLLRGTQGPGRDGDGMLALDLLVVLDAPQLDVETAAVLVESLADGSRLVLSGDPGVLGSAGAGRVFGDLLAARACPQIASRTPDAGPIGELVSGIGIGELGEVRAPDREIVIVPVRDAGEAVHRTVQLVAESVPRAFGVTAGQTQVVTFGHGGPAGTRALNAALKQRLAPGPGRFGGFDPGDRVAYVPSAGRTVQGVVVAAEPEGLRVRPDGPRTDADDAPDAPDAPDVTLLVPREHVETELRHGWALTAHQAAGMRWPAAVVVLPGDAAQALTRTWVYTAFGRGERHLSVVHGVDQALPRAVAEGDAPSSARGTRLRALVQGLLAPEPAL